MSSPPPRRPGLPPRPGLPRRRTGATLLAAAAIGGVFVAGLAVPGKVGGVLLLLVVAVLVFVSSAAARSSARPPSRPLQVLVLAAVVALAVAKLAGKL